MATKLALDSLEIKNFRGLRDMTIKKLGRANLIVGKNNVGKTTILEALKLYAQPGSLDEMVKLLLRHDELLMTKPIESAVSEGENPLPIHRLFHGRTITHGDKGGIFIGPIADRANTLRIVFEEWQGLQEFGSVDDEINEDGT